MSDDLCQIAKDNHAFYYVVLPMHINSYGFKQVVFDSFIEPSQSYVDHEKYSGYVLVNCTDVERDCSSDCLREDIGSGLIGKIMMKFPRNITRTLNDEVTIVEDIWKFHFKITKYERDSAHDFELVEDLSILPGDEVLGRFVELKISINQ